MQTVAVTVAHREQVGMDAYAAPVYRLVEEVVEGCLVEPGAWNRTVECGACDG